MTQNPCPVPYTLACLPTPTGPYGIGIHKTDLFDDHRSSPSSPKGRLIPLQVYFPIKEKSETPFEKIFEERAPKKFKPLKVLTYGRKASLNDLYASSPPVVIMNHGNYVSMTDYGWLCEELASHGYVVLSIQHQLESDPPTASFWHKRSTSKHSHIIDNILYVWLWIQQNNSSLFKDRLCLNQVALMGHSMGANALLLLYYRTVGMFTEGLSTLLPHKDDSNVKECIVFIDGEFSFPLIKKYPILFCLSQERFPYQASIGTLKYLSDYDYPYHHYAHTRHISFTDHGWALKTIPNTNDHLYFDGSDIEKTLLFNKIRQDIREFLDQNSIKPSHLINIF